MDNTSKAEPLLMISVADTDPKRISSARIRALVNAINDEIESVRRMGLQVEISAPSPLSLREQTLSVSIFEKNFY